MVKIVKMRCVHQGCNTRRSFSMDGSKKAEFCFKHARSGMVNVRRDECAQERCTKQPSYGTDDGRKKAEFCSQHARTGMVNVKTKRCAHQGCTTRPSFGVDGSKKAEFWFQHAKPGMGEVMGKKCAHQGCRKQASYGVDNGRKEARILLPARQGWNGGRQEEEVCPPRL